MPQYGTNAYIYHGLVVAKYTDNGNSATLGWAQVGGGPDYDQGTSVAVNGLNVYVTGIITNNTSNASQVVFGGGGTTVGTASQPGATVVNNADLVVAKHPNNGPHGYPGLDTDGQRRRALRPKH